MAAPIAGPAAAPVRRRACWSAGLLSFAVGTAAAALVVALATAGTVPPAAVGLLLAVPLLVAGLGGGSVITPNQALSLAEVDVARRLDRRRHPADRAAIGNAVGAAVISRGLLRGGARGPRGRRRPRGALRPRLRPGPGRLGAPHAVAALAARRSASGARRSPERAAAVLGAACTPSHESRAIRRRRSTPFDLPDDALRAAWSVKWTFPPAGVLPAWVAEMDARPCPPVHDAVRAAVERGDFGYPPLELATGLPQALAAFAAERYGWDVDPGLVVPCGDVMAGVRFALETLCEPAPVVVPVPSYPPLLHVVAAHRAAGGDGAGARRRPPAARRRRSRPPSPPAPARCC